MILPTLLEGDSEIKVCDKELMGVCKSVQEGFLYILKRCAVFPRCSAYLFLCVLTLGRKTHQLALS